MGEKLEATCSSYMTVSTRSEGGSRSSRRKSSFPSRAPSRVVSSAIPSIRCLLTFVPVSRFAFSSVSRHRGVGDARGGHNPGNHQLAKLTSNTPGRRTVNLNFGGHPLCQGARECSMSHRPIDALRSSRHLSQNESLSMLTKIG